MLRAGPLLVSNRGDKQLRFLTLYFKARVTRFFDHSSFKHNQARVGIFEISARAGLWPSLLAKA